MGYVTFFRAGVDVIFGVPLKFRPTSNRAKVTGAALERDGFADLVGIELHLADWIHDFFCFVAHLSGLISFTQARSEELGRRTRAEFGAPARCKRSPDTPVAPSVWK